MTPRDLVALGFIAEAQPVRTDHLATLLGMSAQMVRRRIRVLRDLGVVRVHVVAMCMANRLTLGPKAPDVLRRATGRDRDAFMVPRGIQRVNLAHHERAVDLHVALTVAAARSKRLELVSFLHERAIRQRLGGRRNVQVPDAAAVLRRVDGTEVAVAFEVDESGHQTPSYVAAHKGLAYADLREAGRPLLGKAVWAVCLTTASERRRNRLARALWDAGVPEGLWYFAAAEAITDRTILMPVWLTPRVIDGASRMVAECPFVTVTTDRNKGCDRNDEPEGRFEGGCGPVEDGSLASWGAS